MGELASTTPYNTSPSMTPSFHMWEGNQITLWKSPYHLTAQRLIEITLMLLTDKLLQGGAGEGELKDIKTCKIRVLVFIKI